MKKILFATLLFTLTISCAENGSKESSNSAANLTFLKDLNEEDQEQIAGVGCSEDAEVSAEAQVDAEKCVEICHVPPGHPEGKKTKVVGLSALQAHIDHGCGKNPSKDYVGPCQEDDGLEDDGDDAEDTANF